VKKLLPALAGFVQSQDEEILVGVCWALYDLTKDHSKRIQLVVETGVIPHLLGLLERVEISVLTPALSTIGNIVTGSDAQTECVLTAGLCPLLAALLRHADSNIVKETVWTISNISAGKANQIEQLFDHNVIEPLLQVLTKRDFKCQREVAWAICNITLGTFQLFMFGQFILIFNCKFRLQLGGNFEQIVLLYQSGAFSKICMLLESKDPETVLVVLNVLTYTLAAAKNKQLLFIFLVLHIKESGGLQQIEILKNHWIVEVQKKAKKFLSMFQWDFFSQVLHFDYFFYFWNTLVRDIIKSLLFYVVSIKQINIINNGDTSRYKTIEEKLALDLSTFPLKATTENYPILVALYATFLAEPANEDPLSSNSLDEQIIETHKDMGALVVVDVFLFTSFYNDY